MTVAACYQDIRDIPWLYDSGVSEDALRIQALFAEIFNSFRETITIGEPREEALNSLNESLVECYQDNWDGYGAKAINQYSYCEAKRFIKTLPMTVSIPNVAVDSDGEVSFEWYNRPNKVFTVSFGSNSELTYAGLFGSNKTHGTEYFGDVIPKIILENIQRVYL